MMKVHTSGSEFASVLATPEGVRVGDGQELRWTPESPHRVSRANCMGGKQGCCLHHLGRDREPGQRSCSEEDGDQDEPWDPG